MNSDQSLNIDLYELTMAAGYFQNRVDLKATFELSCHTMPKNRSYLVACGLEQIIDYVLNLKFSDEDINYLKTLPTFKMVKDDFFDYLKNFSFTGDIWALPEGEIFFAKEPILQIEAPIIEAQILETYLLSLMNIECLVASKATRVVQAACFDGMQRGVIDFGSRRAHGPQAAIFAARAAYMAGCLGTSNVSAGKKFGIPLFGTVAHSWVETFDTEQESFEKYFKVYPQNTILLVDTYDTIEAVKKITRLKFKKDIKGIRIDSGNLKLLSKKIRGILDKENLGHIKIVASGNLDEYKILDLVKDQCPIDYFGVGTAMATSYDCPALDLTYKLVQTSSRNNEIKFKKKRSEGKETIPGRKQIFRKFTDQGFFKADLVGLFSEKQPDDPQGLLKRIVKKGELVQPLPSLEEIKKYAQKRVSLLPASFFRLDRKQDGKVELSKEIVRLTEFLDSEVKNNFKGQ